MFHLFIYFKITLFLFKYIGMRVLTRTWAWSRVDGTTWSRSGMCLCILIGARCPGRASRRRRRGRSMSGSARRRWLPVLKSCAKGFQVFVFGIFCLFDLGYEYLKYICGFGKKFLGKNFVVFFVG